MQVSLGLALRPASAPAHTQTFSAMQLSAPPRILMPALTFKMAYPCLSMPAHFSSCPTPSATQTTQWPFLSRMALMWARSLGEWTGPIYVVGWGMQGCGYRVDRGRLRMTQQVR
jgi:hypothetical protein